MPTFYVPIGQYLLKCLSSTCRLWKALSVADPGFNDAIVAGALCHACYSADFQNGSQGFRKVNNSSPFTKVLTRLVAALYCYEADNTAVTSSFWPFGYLHATKETPVHWKLICTSLGKESNPAGFFPVSSFIVLKPGNIWKSVLARKRWAKVDCCHYTIK